MSETMFVVPESGRRVVDPATRQALPAAGADVPRSTYWLRRVREGDVSVASSASSRGTRAPASAASNTKEK